MAQLLGLRFEQRVESARVDPNAAQRLVATHFRQVLRDRQGAGLAAGAPLQHALDHALLGRKRQQRAVQEIELVPRRLDALDVLDALVLPDLQLFQFARLGLFLVEPVDQLGEQLRVARVQKQQAAFLLGVTRQRRAVGEHHSVAEDFIAERGPVDLQALLNEFLYRRQLEHFRGVAQRLGERRVLQCLHPGRFHELVTLAAQVGHHQAQRGVVRHQAQQRVARRRSLRGGGAGQDQRGEDGEQVRAACYRHRV